jgi:hypothetical protein
MKKFLPLLLCLLLSIFTVARATKPAHTPAPDTKTAQNKARGQEADAKTLLNANTDEEVASDDDDSMEVAPSDEGEDMNDDDGGDAPGDEDTGDDDGGDDGGGDEGE